MTLPTQICLKEPSTGFFSGSFFPNERKRILAFAIAFMVLTTIPYFIGYANQGGEWRFIGFVFGVEDGNSYIAKMLRGSVGDWLFRTPYTPHQQNGVFAYFSYLLLGKLAASPGEHEQLVVLFHFYRIIAGVLDILAIYEFISLFVNKWYMRFIGLIVTCLGGGLGYILILFGSQWWLGSLPLEFYSPESFGFLTLFGLPHLAMARTLFFGGLIFYLRTDIKTGGILTGLLWLIMGIFQPLTIVQAWVIIAGHFLYMTATQIRNLLIRKDINAQFIKDWGNRVVWAGSIPLPLVLYTFITFNIDPVVSGWTAQNIIHSPHPLHYFLAYGLVLPFAVKGVVGLFKSEETGNWLLPIWFLLFPFLIYVPYDLQRRLAEGFWVCLIILFLIAMERLNRPLRRLGIFLLILTLPSCFIIYTGAISAVLNPTSPIFRPVDEVEVFQYLAEKTEEGSVIFCSYETGNALPAWSPDFVVVGHGPESVGINELLPKVDAFFNILTTNLVRKELLKDVKADYVFWGPAERNLGKWNPETVDYLELIFQKEGYILYRVRQFEN